MSARETVRERINKVGQRGGMEKEMPCNREKREQGLHILYKRKKRTRRSKNGSIIQKNRVIETSCMKWRTIQ